MEAARNADSTTIKPLTKRTAEGKLYVRRPDAELQIEKALSLETAQILEMLGAAKERGDETFLLDETLVYLLRQARRANDDDLLNELYIELNKRIWKKLAKFRGNFNNQADFEDFGQKTEMAIIKKILNVESNAGDFAQAQFGSFVLSEAKAAWKQDFVRIKKDRESLDTPRGSDDEETDQLENKADLRDEFSAEKRLIYEEQMRNFSPEQQIIAAMLLDGFQIESKRPEEMTISKYLNITSRTIRTRIKKMREILNESKGEAK